MPVTAVVYKELNLRKLRNVTLLVLYSVVSFFFLVNGPGVFSQWTSAWTMSTIVYLLGVSVFLGVHERLPVELESQFSKVASNFLVSFMVATALFMVLLDLGLYFHGVSAMPVEAIPATLLYQLVIVVCSEEIIFRGVIYRFLHQFNWFLAIIVSSLLFSLFHVAVYEFNVAALTTAFFMGLILAWCVKRWDIGAAIGIHFAWNAFVLGATVLV